MLEELGVSYEVKKYQRDPKTMLAPQSLRDVHPLGKSPVLTDDAIAVAESGAIIDYLAQVYGSEGMIPVANTQPYRDYVYWLHYSEGSLMPQLLLKLVFDKVKTSPMPFFIKPIAKMISDKVMAALVGPNIKSNLEYIDGHLAKQDWFAGDALSGADIQMSFPLEASVARGIVSDKHPNIKAYVKRIHERPAYKKALEIGGEYDYT